MILSRVPFHLKLLIVALLVWHTILCLTWLLSGAFVWTAYVYGPTIKFPDDMPRDLDDCPITTDNIKDLYVNDGDTNETLMENFKTNGVSIVPNVLSQDTITELRKYVDKANKEMHQAFVLDAENRYRIMPTPFETPIVAKAMGELAEHPKLRALVDGALGPYASLVAFSFITSKYGAVKQDWHRDTHNSKMSHYDEFVHECTLTIPLQDVTHEMGATQICPGTHWCGWVDYDQDKIIEETNYTPTPDDEGWDSYAFEHEHLPCQNISATLGKGDALMYHTDLLHRGGEFYDEQNKDLDRIIMFITFAESIKVNETKWFDFFDKKSLPLGKVHSLDWKMWGLTIDDFPNLMRLHENTWLGKKYQNFKSVFYGPVFGYTGEKSTVRPWTTLDAFMMIFSEPGGKCYLINNDYDAQEARHVSSKVMYFTFAFTFLYCWIAIPLWMYAAVKLSGLSQQQQQQPPYYQNGTHLNGISNGHHANGNGTAKRPIENGISNGNHAQAA